MSDAMVWAIFIVAAYGLGSIPFGLVIGLARGVDIREQGSGNIGATNARRILGPGPGAAVFALDVAKGAIPVALAGLVMGVLGERSIAPAAQGWWLAVAGAAVGGHVFPVWLRFRGGKGVATGFGALAAMWPMLTPAALGALLVWVLVLRLSRNVGVSSSVAAAALPIITVGVVAVLGEPGRGPLGRVIAAGPTLLATTALAGVVIARHRVNLRLAYEGWKTPEATSDGGADRTARGHHSSDQQGD